MNKKRTLIPALVIFVILVASCAAREENEVATLAPTLASTSPATTPLPTAVQPDSTAGGTWALTFRYDFPENYWQAGDHSYGFIVDCPEIAYDFNTEWLPFRVTENVEALPFPVYLRLSGLSLEPYTPAYMPESRIHPDQVTAALIHLVGLSEEQVESARDGCEVIIGWDSAPPQALQPTDAFRP